MVFNFIPFTHDYLIVSALPVHHTKHGSISVAASSAKRGSIESATSQAASESLDRIVQSPSPTVRITRQRLEAASTTSSEASKDMTVNKRTLQPSNSATLQKR